MRVAFEVSGDPKYHVGPTRALPSGFSVGDLAALTVWFLISEGHRTVTAHFNEDVEGVEISMTIGVPLEFFHDKQLKASFLSMARRAWTFYCAEGPVDSALLIENARRVLEEHPALLAAISDGEIQDWIRSEDEAAIWWLLNSPAVGTGAYAKVDIGAGTTHANLFRIFGKVQTPKRSFVAYSAASVTVGMDAVDRAIAECERVNGSGFAVRGLEQSILQANARVSETLTPVCEQIYGSYRKAWMEICRKMSGNAIELSAWRQHKLFVIGGGSLLPLLVDTFRIHPDRQDPLSVMPLEQPTDLVRADHRKITGEELPFVSVAYGLSNFQSLLPNPYCRDPG
jgi:hypothetical protein